MLEDAWEYLCEKELRFVPSFTELRQELEGGGIKFRILVAIDNSQIIAIACFRYWNTKKTYEIVTRRLFGLPVKVVSLYGSCVLGQPSEDVARSETGSNTNFCKKIALSACSNSIVSGVAALRNARAIIVSYAFKTCADPMVNAMRQHPNSDTT
jgi:hypothetical protein